MWQEEKATAALSVYKKEGGGRGGGGERRGGRGREEKGEEETWVGNEKVQLTILLA